MKKTKTKTKTKNKREEEQDGAVAVFDKGVAKGGDSDVDELADVPEVCAEDAEEVDPGAEDV